MMSFSTNSSQQMSIFDSALQLTQRKIKMLEKSRTEYFAENISVNIIIGTLIIKEIFQLTDEEIVEALPFDIRYQYALHTTSFEKHPFKNRTHGRFRTRCNTCVESTGVNLIYSCIVSLSSEMAKLMKLNTGMRHMDSLMVAPNIKK